MFVAVRVLSTTEFVVVVVADAVLLTTELVVVFVAVGVLLTAEFVVVFVMWKSCLVYHCPTCGFVKKPLGFTIVPASQDAL